MNLEGWKIIKRQGSKSDGDGGYQSVVVMLTNSQSLKKL